MNPTEFERLRALFDELIELDADGRAAALAHAADLSADTRGHLQRLLGIDSQIGRSTARQALSALRGAPAPGASGQRIGAFELEHELGRGGMGSVWLAHRADGVIEQKVAVKLIRPEQLDAHTLARFRLERQVLALLKHPNIAVLHDLGEIREGVPYAVMEYVEGQPITEFCRAQRLDLRQRLRLWLDVCHAVSYAHRNMVVHRDIKPGNILVTPEGRPKLLDFGIAKPLVTRYGAQDVGETATAQRFFSPSNAAPEQLRGEPVNVTCDVYGLGVLLYELLTDSAPFDFTGKTPGEAERMILEQDPAPPSARSGDRALRGDLDAIVARALRKSAAERYATVDAFADDVRRYLDGHPVAAARGRRLYRLRKLVGRHRVALGVGTLIAAVVVGSAIALLRERGATQSQHARADQMTQLILASLKSVDAAQVKGKETTAREIFERVSTQAIASRDLDPAARANVLAAIANIELKLGLPQQAAAALEQVDVELLEPAQRDETLQVRANTLIALGKFDDTYPVVARGLGAAADAETKANWRLIEAKLLHEHGKLDAALDELKQLRVQPTSLELKDRIRAQLATAYDTLGKQTESYDEYAALLAEQRQRMDKDDPILMTTLIGYSRICAHLDRVEQAKAAADEAMGIALHVYGRQSLRYIQAVGIRQGVAYDAGDLPEAIRLQTEVMQTMEQLFPEQSPQIARSHFNLGALADQAGNVKDAELHLRKAVEIARRVWLPEDVNNLLFPVGLACFLINQGRIPEAAAVAHDVLANIDAHPALKDFDVYPLVQFMVTLGDYDAHPTPASRSTAAAAFAHAREAAEGVSTKRAIAHMAKTLEKSGVIGKVAAGP